jgi:broad specificity phosphatase PhoE
MTDQSIYLVRHAETAFNADGRLHGFADPDLNAAGLGQAKSLASDVESAGTSIIIPSSLLNAVHVAAIIAHSCQTEHKVDVRFNDRDYGRWTGQPKTDVIALGDPPRH